MVGLDKKYDYVGEMIVDSVKHVQCNVSMVDWLTLNCVRLSL